MAGRAPVSAARRWAGRGLAVGALALSLATGGSAQTALDMDSARRYAATLLAQGQHEAARRVLSVLARHDPSDPALLIGLSQAERGAGKPDEAARTGRLAFRHARSDVQHFAAARTTAQALSASGHRTRAQLWLRRAGHHAPSDAARAQVRRDYAYVRARNPWAVDLDLSVRPTDNVNNAPTSNRLEFGGIVGIDPTAVPIEGLEHWASARLRYRLPATATAQQGFGIGWVAKRVTLGSEAARIDPDLRAEDLAFDRLALEWYGKFRRGEGAPVTDVRFGIFADRQGDVHLQNGAALSLGRRWNLSHGLLRVGYEAEKLDRRDVSLRSSLRQAVHLDWQMAVRDRDRLSMGLSLWDTDSRSALIDHRGAELRAAYALGRPVLGAHLELAAAWRTARYDRAFSPLFPIREDERLSLTTTAAFPVLQLYGFAPVVELRHDRNRSNIASFDTRATSLGLALRSIF